jgi:RimJ/RimL family protein N-acetyltransferase
LGTGAGRALLGEAQAELARLGFGETVLWVLTGNARARRFYEIAGWVADGSERTGEVFGITVPEVRYRRRSTSDESSSATPAGTE